MFTLKTVIVLPETYIFVQNAPLLALHRWNGCLEVHILKRELEHCYNLMFRKFSNSVSRDALSFDAKQSGVTSEQATYSLTLLHIVAKS